MDFKDFITKRHAVRRFTDRQIKYSGSVVKTKTLGFFNESLAC